MIRILQAAGVFVAFATLTHAQPGQTMTASIRGGGGDRGKCTIEVEVDGVAEVEIRGDRGFIRTLSGQPSTWRRFECNSMMPRNPGEFRFKGIDGRGRQDLVRDPNNGGVAVVRIEDSKGGREGYTFDLEWRGGSGTFGNNDRPWGRDDRDGGRGTWNNDRNSGRGVGRDRYDSRAVNMCQDVVRARARRDYGVRDVRFRSSNANDLRGNRDRVTGEFEGNRGEWYEYSCTVNGANGDIRNVDIRRR